MMGGILKCFSCEGSTYDNYGLFPMPIIKRVGSIKIIYKICLPMSEKNERKIILRQWVASSVVYHLGILVISQRIFLDTPLSNCDGQRSSAVAMA